MTRHNRAPGSDGPRRGLLGLLAAVVLLSAAIGPPARSGTPSGSRDARIDALFAPWDAPASPGAVVAAAREGAFVYSRAFGQAVLAHDVPLSPQTRLNAGSIAKQFTATAILILESAGRLSLDDDIREYLPDFPDYGNRITLRHLLHHTSGVRDFLTLTSLAGWLPADARTQAQAMRLIRRQQALNFEPGENFLYSNSNYVLLAAVIERITGQEFADWMAEKIFSPLGMHATQFQSDHREIVPRRAASYHAMGAGRRFREDVLSNGVVGSGNLITTAGDLMTWAHHLMTAEMGGAPLLTLLTTTPPLPEGLETAYGMGLMTGSYRGLRAVYHGGASGGYRSHLLLIPSQEFAVTVLGNVDRVDARTLTRRVADIVLAETFPEPAGSDGADASEGAMDLELAAYAGLYQLETGVLLDVRIIDEQPVFLLSSVVPRRLFPAGGHSFTTDEPGVRLTFAADKAGEVVRLTLTLPGHTFDARPVERVTLRRADLRDYAGRYYSAELDTFYTLRPEDGGLVMEHLRRSAIRLQAIGGDRFVERRLPDLTVRFERNRFRRVTGFRISVQRARNIAFDKK